MTTAGLLIAFFLFTLMAVSAAGYMFVLKPSSAAGDDAESPSALVRAQPDLPAPQAAILDIFRLIGNAVPEGSAQRSSARKLLLLAGFRWPSAVSSFLGIKIATAFTLGVAGAWASVTFSNGNASSLAADRKSTRLNSSHIPLSRMPSSA